MIDILESLDINTALGILARAALALDEANNPASRAVLDNEMELRQRLFSIAREQTGISPDDHSEESRERIGEFLDHEAEAIAGPTDTQAALLRLARSGSLPSDMYEIHVNPAVSEWCIDPTLEQDLITATVSHPDKEQHFGPSPDLTAPSLVSLFIRHFTTKWPYKNFYLLVVGSRDGLVLRIGQAWRVYPALIDIQSCTNLVEVLEKFADIYGSPVEWEGKTRKFFLTVGEPISNNKIMIQTNRKHKETIGISQITQAQNGNLAAALVISINLIKYKEVLATMKVNRGDIITSLAVAKLSSRQVT